MSSVPSEAPRPKSSESASLPDLQNRKSDLPLPVPPIPSVPSKNGERDRSENSKRDGRPGPPGQGANILILGRKGSGKTTRVLELLEHHSRVLIIDPFDEYSAGAVQVRTPEGLAAYISGATGQWRIAYHNDHLNDDFPFLCDAAYELEDCEFVVEECDWFCNPSQIPPAFERLIKYGRHNRVGIIAITRRPAEVHRLVTSQAWELYAFTCQEPRDLEYLTKFVGPEFASGLLQLPPHTYRYQDLWNRHLPWQESHTVVSKRRAHSG